MYIGGLHSDLSATSTNIANSYSKGGAGGVVHFDNVGTSVIDY